jgi:Icc-related predicted phosphoesterase
MAKLDPKFMVWEVKDASVSTVTGGLQSVSIEDGDTRVSDEDGGVVVYEFPPGGADGRFTTNLHMFDLDPPGTVDPCPPRPPLDLIRISDDGLYLAFVIERNERPSAGKFNFSLSALQTDPRSSMYLIRIKLESPDVLLPVTVGDVCAFGGHDVGVSMLGRIPELRVPDRCPGDNLRVRVVSDLHADHCPIELVPGEEDVLVIAGDVSDDQLVSLQIISDYVGRSRSVHVVFVLGNHDYYAGRRGITMADIERFWSTVTLPRFHFLQDKGVSILGQWFYGATLWTDLNKTDPLTVAIVACGITDFSGAILVDSRSAPIEFRPLHSVSMHLQSRTKMLDFLDRTEGSVVVVTHHLPSMHLVDPKYGTDAMNGAFAATDMAEAIEHPRVATWIHGHTHTSGDSFRSGVRFVCNPRGYVLNGHAENPAFDAGLIVEVPADVGEPPGCGGHTGATKD